MKYAIRSVRRLPTTGPSPIMYVYSGTAHHCDQQSAYDAERNHPHTESIIDISRVDDEADLESTLAPNTEN